VRLPDLLIYHPAMSFQFRVKNLMSSQVRTLEMNAALSLADEVMAMERIRHLPVLDEDEELVGIVTQRDLFRGALARALGFGDHAQQKILDTLKVKDVMHTEPVTIGPDAHVREAARLMLQHKIGCLPVIEQGRLVGIVTESDFVELFSREDE
jgi:CBS domain-containing protein